MIVLTLGQRVVEVEISSGVNRGNCILIPYITKKIVPSDTELPFTLKHHQFPLRPCFAMSTSKAQGQTLQFVGIYLPSHVFTHDQLYVAFSSYRPISSCCVLEQTRWIYKKHCVSGSFVTFHVHFVQNSEISVPPDIPCEARVGH